MPRATISASFLAPNTAGNLLFARLVVKGVENDGCPFLTDSNGNTWTTYSARKFFGKYWGVRFYSANAASGPNTVTGTFAGSGVARLRIAEIPYDVASTVGSSAEARPAC